MVVIEHAPFDDFILRPFFIAACVIQVLLVAVGDMKPCEFGKEILFDAKCLCAGTADFCQLCGCCSVKGFLCTVKILLLACVPIKIKVWL